MKKTLIAMCLLALSPAVANDVLAQVAPRPQAPAAAALDPAARPVRAFCDALLESMKRGRELGIPGRFKKLEPVIDAAFDFPAMTQLMIGPAWTTMSTADHELLISGVRRMTIANYARNFDDYGGESFVIDPAIQERAGDRIVSTEMMVPEKESVSFVYRMRASPAGWKIVDIFLDGSISQVALRRSDFASTLRSGGAPALARKLDELVNRMLTPAS